MSGRALIVGSGIAGGTCALTLAAIDPAWDVEMVGGLHGGVCDRPQLSKRYLTTDGLPIPAAISSEALAAAGVRHQADASAVSLDLRVQECRLSDGRAVRWDRLVLACGAAARRLQIPGSDLAGVHYLREPLDAVSLRDRLRTVHRLVVIGSGLIGLEVAASARTLGVSVVVVTDTSAALTRVIPEELAEFVVGRHREAGVEFRFADPPTAILGDGRVRSVRLTSGASVDADAVLVAIGARPRDRLAADAGMAVEDGVLVDASMRSTTHPNVSAIGDLARLVSVAPSRRYESWMAAQRQGEVAATVIAGRVATFEDAPWFWSDQYDEVLQSTGWWDQAARIVTSPTTEVVPAAAFGLIGQRLVAAASFGRNPGVGQLISVASRLIAGSCAVADSDLTSGAGALRSALRDSRVGRA